MLGRLLLWGACNLVLLACAYRLTASFATGVLRLDVLACGSWYVALTSVAVLLAGLAGLLTPAAFVVAASAVVMLAVLGRRRVLDDRARGVLAAHRQALGACTWPAGRLHRVGLVVLAVWGLLAGLRLAAHVWLLPPFIWDVWSYHLPRVAEWVRAGALITFETPVARVYWPANFELLQTWFALFPHHDAVIELPGVGLYALCCGCVYATARALQLTWGMAALATVTYAQCPMLLLSATSCKNDIVICFVWLLLVALAADLRARPDASARPHLVVSLVALAYAIGTKPYIVVLAGGILVLALWAAAARGGVAALLRDLGRAARGDEGSRVPLVGVVLLALPLASYWYLRNWALFDNPMHPTDLHLFGRLVFGTGEGTGQQGSLSLSSLLQNGRQLVTEDILDRYQPYSAEAHLTSNWGWFAFSCGLPCLALGAVLSPALRWLGAAFVVALIGLLAGVRPDPSIARFMAWFPALLSLAFVVVLSRLGSRLWRGTMIALAVLTTTLNFVATLDVGRLDPAQWKHMMELPVQERTAVSLRRHNSRWYEQSLAAVPPGEPLGYDVSPTGWTYPLYGPDFGRAIEYIPITRETDIARSLREAGLRYLFVPYPSGQAGPKLRHAVETGALRVVERGLFVHDR